MINFELIPTTQLPERLVDDIDHAADSVYLQSMEFTPTGNMRRICSALLHTAERGIATTLAFDDISLRDRRANSDSIRDFCKRLTVYDTGNVSMLGDPTPPARFFGRSHGKLYRADEVSYIGGGTNLSEKGMEQLDYMLRTTDLDVARVLDDVKFLSLPDANHEDTTIELDELNTLLIDGGTRFSSLILDSAIILGADARRAWYISQYSPAASLAVELRKLEGNSLSKFNTVKSNAESAGRWTARIDRLLTKVDNEYTGDQRIHAKCLVVEHPDGTLEAISGSHNFSSWGVRFGTKEIALQTRDQKLCKELVSFIESS